MDLLLDMRFSLAAQCARSKAVRTSRFHITAAISHPTPRSEVLILVGTYCRRRVESVCTPVSKQIESRIIEVE